MIENIIEFFSKHLFFEILIYAILMDTFLGVLRAIKEHKFNSCVGIDGMIRKVAMLFSVLFLIIIDSITQIDFLFMIPDEFLQYIGLDRLGICSLFCLMFILFESISILKNMTLCGLPIPNKLKDFIQRFLDNMTEELPKEVTSSIHKESKGE
jgi:toxin secretion/phage lysis holin